MNKKLFIVQKEEGAQVISAGVLTRTLVAKLDESQVPYKRKDVISYAAGMVDGLNGTSITEDTYVREIGLAVQVFQEFAKLTLIGFRNMLLRLSHYDRIENSMRGANPEQEVPAEPEVPGVPDEGVTDMGE